MTAQNYQQPFSHTRGLAQPWGWGLLDSTALWPGCSLMRKSSSALAPVGYGTWGLPLWPLSTTWASGLVHTSLQLRVRPAWQRGSSHEHTLQDLSPCPGLQPGRASPAGPGSPPTVFHQSHGPTLKKALPGLQAPQTLACRADHAPRAVTQRAAQGSCQLPARPPHLAGPLLCGLWLPR